MDPASPIVAGDRACISCGYSLRGLPTSANCPECGVPVADSLRGTLLRHASPAYIGQVRLGHSLVLLGILATIILAVVAFVGTVAWMAIAVAQGATTPSSLPPSMNLLLNFAGFAVGIISLIGYLKLTVADPQFSGTDQPLTARKFVRIMVMVQLATSVAQVVLGGVSMGISGQPGLTAGMGISLVAAGLVQSVAWAAQFFAMMLFMRWLAGRVPDAQIVGLTRTYIWLLPVLTTVGALCIGIGPIVALVLYCLMLWRMRQILVAIERERSAGLVVG